MKDRVGSLLLRWRIRAVLPHVEGDLLDIGCGTNQLKRAYGGGVGVDVHRWDGVDLVVDDSSRLPFAAKAFGTVTIVAALNHIPNRRAVLAEAYRVLRPGGRLVVTMIPPRLSAVWHALRRRWDCDQRERGMKEGEVYGLTRREVHELLAAAGFTIARERPFMLGLNRVYVAVKRAAAKASARRAAA